MSSFILFHARSDYGNYIIASGGDTVNGITDSTEIIEPGMTSWGKGPSLPKPTFANCMIEDHQTSSVLLVGGYSNTEWSSAIYQLKAPLTVTR